MTLDSIRNSCDIFFTSVVVWRRILKIADMEAESMGVKASLQRAWEIGQWTDVVLVGGDHTEVREGVQVLTV